jgi:VIT1/CCC1 family predicted Fe2+/Mn2+ transporter
VVTESDPAPDAASASHPEHHRRVQGGAARAAVFGVSDGLVSNMGLILGVAGADPVPAAVRLAGVAGLVAGAVSMGAGEYNSMRVQAELLQRELDIEERELRSRPQFEADELALLYERRGLPAEGAQELAEAVMRDPDTALEAHAREELGVDPNELGRPLSAAVSSFLCFSLGAGAAGPVVLRWGHGGDRGVAGPRRGGRRGGGRGDRPDDGPALVVPDRTPSAVHLGASGYHLPDRSGPGRGPELGASAIPRSLLPGVSHP